MRKKYTLIITILSLIVGIMVLDVSIGRYLAEKDVLKKAEVFCREFPSSSKASNFFAEYPELLVPALIEIAKDEKSPQKRNALFFLATMKEPRASDIFIKYLRSNDSKERVDIKKRLKI